MTKMLIWRHSRRSSSPVPGLMVSACSLLFCLMTYLLCVGLVSGFSPQTQSKLPPRTCSPEQQTLRLLFPPAQRPTTSVFKGQGVTVFEQPFYTTTDIKTRMSVLKLKDSTIIYSPVAATEECIELVREAAGAEPTHIIMQNDAIDHTLFLPGWREAFPSARVLAVSPFAPTDEALVRVGEDGRKEAQLPAAWTTDRGGPLKAAVLDVSPFFTEVVLLHVPSKTLFVADSIWRVVSPQFSTNIVASVGWGIFGVKDTSRFPYWFYFPQRRKEQVRAFVEEVSTWDFKRVVTGHLDMVREEEDAKAIFLSSFDFILQ